MRGNDSESILCLQDLGFSEREAKVYLALLNKSQGTAVELQKISGVPQSKIYEVVDGLVHKGYCTEIRVGRKRTFEIVNPQHALNPSFIELHKRFQNSLSLKKKLTFIYSKSEKTTKPLDYIEVLRGNDNIHHRYCQLVNSARKELLGFGRRPYACDTKEKSDEQDKYVKQIIQRNVETRWVYQLNLPDEDWLIPDLHELQDSGAKIRVAEMLPLKMMIFDRELLLMAEEEPFGRVGELAMSLIKQNTIVKAFCALFEYFWQNSLELEIWEKTNLPKYKQCIGNNRGGEKQIKIAK